MATSGDGLSSSLRSGSKGDMALVLDFGSQYSHLIARRCREAGVYSVLVRGDVSLEVMESYNPKAVILSGGPFSVFEAGAPSLAKGVLEFLREEAVPTLGICYGMQLLMHLSPNGVVEASADKREYGAAFLSPATDDDDDDDKKAAGAGPLFDGITFPSKVWMSHGDKVASLAEGFRSRCSTETCKFAAVEALALPFWGLQFHPEVAHTADGQTETAKR